MISGRKLPSSRLGGEEDGKGSGEAGERGLDGGERRKGARSSSTQRERKGARVGLALMGRASRPGVEE